MLKLFIFILFLISEYNVYSFDCTIENLTNCLTWMESLSRIEKVSYSIEELKNVCQKLQHSLSCVNYYIHRCLSSSQREIFNRLFSETSEFLKDLCIPGTFQERYLNHSGCIREVLTDEKICLPKFYEKMALIQNIENEDFNMIKAHCCALHEYTVCQKALLVESCGQDAADIHQIVGEKISGPQIMLVCSPYRTEDYCNNELFE